MTTYSPSASTSEGNAPISSRMMSPPGVSTVKVVLASASAPGALTSFIVSVAKRWRSVTSTILPGATLTSPETIELVSTGVPAPAARLADAHRADADGVEISGGDVVSALGHADHLALARLGVDELGLRVVALGHVDGERQLRGIDRRVAERAVDPERAGGERELLGMGLGGERNAPGRAGQTERDVQHVIARGQRQARLREARTRRPAHARRRHRRARRRRANASPRRAGRRPPAPPSIGASPCRGRRRPQPSRPPRTRSRRTERGRGRRSI